ncbi:TPA: hypothetical protein ACX6Q0_003521 [Photobacterium damselae]
MIKYSCKKIIVAKCLGGKERIGSILLYRTEGDEEEREKGEEKVLGEMRKSWERRNRRFGGDEEEREKGEEKVWGMRKSKKLDPRRYGIKL